MVTLLSPQCPKFVVSYLMYVPRRSVVCGKQLGNYAAKIIQMTLESASIYEIHHFQLQFVFIYRKEVKNIAITYFLATLANLATKIAITRYLPSNRIDLELVALDSHSNSTSFGKMHMYDMVKIEIVGGGGGVKAPPPDC